MPTAYSYTEQIVTKDTATGNVVSDQTIVHTVTWQDADAATYRVGKVQDAQAIMDGTASVARTNRVADAVAVAAALNTGEKGLIDYDTAAKKTAGLALNQDMVDKAKAMNLLLFPEWFKQADASADAHLTADSQAKATAFATALTPLFDAIKPSPAPGTPNPKYISSAGAAVMDSNGSVLSLDASNYVYKDGAPMKKGDGTRLAASLVCVFGRSIYARGLTQPDWWAWTGLGWSGPIVGGDPAILIPA